MLLNDLQYELLALLIALIALSGMMLLFFAHSRRRKELGLIILMVGLSVFVLFMKLVP
jgi:hypothetical protein